MSRTLSWSAYRSWVFDCDGVLLDSNAIKSRAMFEVALPHGQASAEELVRHHVQHGGVSRFKKFAYFLDSILAGEPKDGELERMLEAFGVAVKRELLTCTVAPGLRPLLGALAPDVKRLIVSGGAQDELREVFEQRGFGSAFDGIFGSPDTKADILRREIESGALVLPALMIGDSRLDHEAAIGAGLDFVFLHGWTEVEDWSDFVGANAIEAHGDLADLARLVGDEAQA